MPNTKSIAPEHGYVTTTSSEQDKVTQNGDQVNDTAGSAYEINANKDCKAESTDENNTYKSNHTNIGIRGKDWGGYKGY